MQIGVITDTHDNKDTALKAIDVFKSQNVDLVIHAGDMVSPFTAAHFADLEMPFKYHLGNNEGELFFLKDTIEKFGGEMHRYDFEVDVTGRKFLVQHEPENLEALAASGKYDVIIYGHTHDVDIRKHQGSSTLIFNPGECCSWLRGLANVAIINAETLEYELISLL